MMTFKSYVETGGEQCPKCGSKAIKASALPEKIKADRIEVSMFCATCGARWRDIFTLSKAEDL
jgi:C4-type Zn-finger protein